MQFCRAVLRSDHHRDAVAADVVVQQPDQARLLLDHQQERSQRLNRDVFLVAPDNREADVRAQLQRPAFQGVARLHVRFLPYSELERHREAMARFGAGLKAIEAVARTLT